MISAASKIGIAAMDEQERSRTHHALEFLGLRAQATAIGLVQLCAELRRTGVIDEDAVGRVKDAIASELAANAPRTAVKQQFLADIRGRLDRIFAGQQPVGPSLEGSAKAAADEGGA